MTKIAVIVGSLRRDSLNKKLADNLVALAPKGVEFTYVDINLPLFNADHEYDMDKSVRKAKDIVEASDGVLIVTPEYNRSIPGVLKNAIDWLSRPWGENSFDGKAMGIAGASGGAVGTAVGQAALRVVAGFLNVRLMGQPELYFNFAENKLDENAQVVGEYRESLQTYIDTFVKFVENK